MNITKMKGNPLYWNAKFLDPKEPMIVTVEDAVVRQISGENRVILLFKNEERELKLTPHQVAAMARRYGDDTDAWKGACVHLTRGEDKGVLMAVVSEPQPPEGA
jgi:hypothetical protein